MTTKQGTHDMPWDEVKTLIAEKGSTLRDIALANDYHPSAASRVQDLPWPGMQAAIAEFLGVDPSLIWPTRYDNSGSPVSYKTWRKANTPEAPAHAKKAMGAST